MNNQKTFEELIKQRQDCIKCHHDDNLRHFDKILSKDGLPNLLGPWRPTGENSLDAEILIIGQDFGIFQYLKDARDMNGLINKEKENSTNKKLKKYLGLAGLLDKRIHYTNAILCIKSGESKKTKSGTSMSAKVEPDWFKNCSNQFLKPLITDHLPNLKTIITLGKYALFSINQIIDDDTEISKPLIELVAKKLEISISNKPYTLIPMLHPSFDHLSVRGQSEGKKAKMLWEDIRDKIQF